uniref:Uncharacterized protein n=1 Tax=Xenopus tropicalis TaxID=8364 RepID=A0A1B8Y6C7_XENTR
MGTLGLYMMCANCVPGTAPPSEKTALLFRNPMHLQTTMLQNELPTRSIKRHVCITNMQKPVVCRAESHKLNPMYCY